MNILKRILLIILFVILGGVTGLGLSIAYGFSPLSYTTRTWETTGSGGLFDSGVYHWTLHEEWKGGEWRFVRSEVDVLKRESRRDGWFTFGGSPEIPPRTPMFYNLLNGFPLGERWMRICATGIVSGLMAGGLGSYWFMRKKTRSPKSDETPDRVSVTDSPTSDAGDDHGTGVSESPE
jgi:hypothetical protein